MKKIFILITCGLAAQASSAFGMMIENGYSQPCYYNQKNDEFSPLLQPSDSAEVFVLRIKNKQFVGQDNFISATNIDTKDVESIGKRHKDLNAASADITYNCKTGRWSDESNQEIQSHADLLNNTIWPSQAKIVFGNGGPPPNFKVVEPPVDEKIVPPKAKDGAGKKGVVKENEKEAPKPKSKSAGVSLSPTGKCLLFGGISLVGIAIFAAVKYAKKKKQEDADADQTFEGFDQEQAAETLVS